MRYEMPDFDIAPIQITPQDFLSLDIKCWKPAKTLHMKKTLAVINTVVIVATIAFNSVASTGGINGNTVGGMSDKYDTLFTPSGYAFSIWGIIYIGLIAFGIFQLRRAFAKGKENDFILQVGPWMTVANIANILWLYAWLYEYIGLSLVLMLIILGSLMVMVVRLNMERWDAPFPIIVFVWWPIGIYGGWIAVATIANVSSLLVSLEWQALLNAEGWAVLMIMTAVILNLIMILLRNMREFAVVGIWALVAISVRHWDSLPALQWTALTGAIVLFLVIVVHGFLNRATGLHIK